MNRKLYFYLIGAGILLVLGSFSIGFLYATEVNDTNQILITKFEGGYYVGEEVKASRQGSVYYPWYCSHLQKLKQDNLISFINANEAERAGYRKSKMC